MEKKLNKLKETLKLAKLYRHALGIIYFDFETIVPEKGREEESDVLNFLDNELFKILNNEETKKLIVDLNNHKEELKNPTDQALIDKLYKKYLKEKNITPEFNLKRSTIFSKAYSDWLDAKNSSDFSLFKDSLKEIISIQKEEVSYRENKFDDYYDSLLDDHEEGLLQEDLDPFFAELKEGLLELLNKIKNSKHVIREDFLDRHVPVHKQEAFSRYLLELNGYDFSRGALTTTEHPFTMDVAKNDARVTTHYYENQFVSSIFSTIHEGGHAIFMQNERDEDYEHFINDYITSGMHESVSRFYENVIGRSREYIHLIYPKFKEIFKEEFPDVSEEELYEAVNIVKPSLIRTEADEVTYALHIIIRYEIEKLICHNQVKLDDIPAKWNSLYKEYLGVDVPNDSVGVLQDVHWSSGFGYFPSYSLGNCYNAMYLQTMKKEIPFNKYVEEGNFAAIKDWLKNHVFIHANLLTPEEWLKEITGEDLSPKAFLEYLNNKYSKIYRF